jgi:arylsulfatase A-like enzyme
VPTILELLEVDAGIAFDGLSLAALFKGGSLPAREEFYITECTWMRKHGWRTPKWKLVVALEPDFHGKPPVELYDLENDPLELENVAEIHPETVDLLKRRMEEHIAAREAATGRKNPMYTNTNWHGLGTGPFASSREAYEALRIRYLR